MASPALVLLSWQPWLWEFADLKKGLAILGGALLGGVFVALLAQGATRIFTGQMMPRWMIRLVGILGAVVGGWIVALLVSSGGGGNGEGPGGPGSGSFGIGVPSGQTGRQDTAPTGRSDNGATNRSTGQAGDTLRVDVLEQPEVRRLTGEEGVAARRYFRIPGRSDLLTPDELKRAVERRRQDDPKLKYLELVLQGKDSPSEGSNLIHDLVAAWGPENKLTVRVIHPGGG